MKFVDRVRGGKSKTHTLLDQNLHICDAKEIAERWHVDTIPSSSKSTSKVEQSFIAHLFGGKTVEGKKLVEL